MKILSTFEDGYIFEYNLVGDCSNVQRGRVTRSWIWHHFLISFVYLEIDLKNESMTKRLILITGGSSGIGKATAAALYAQGDSELLQARNLDKL